jgi:hypothetical protein
MNKRLSRLAVSAALVALPLVGTPLHGQQEPAVQPPPVEEPLRDAGRREAPPRDGMGVGELGILAILALVGFGLGLPAVFLIRRWDWQQRGQLEGPDQPPTADPPEWTAPNPARAERALSGRPPYER